MRSARPSPISMRSGCFFLLWPLFARAPRHGFLENFLLSARVCKVFLFCCAPLGASAGPEQKKKTPPRVFFFCSGPGERHGKEKPRWAPARGQSKKKTPPRVFFFLLRPWAPARGQSKKKHHSGCFFLLRPRGKAGEGEASLGAGTGPEQKKKNTTQGVFFFCSGPGERQGKEKPRWAPARGQSKKKNTTQGVFFFAPALGAGTGPEQKKKHHPGCVFFCSGPKERQGKEKLRWAPARGQSKKKTPPRWCFFLLRPRADAHSLTHCGPRRRCFPSPGWCFFFCCGPARGPGWCFFFCCGPAGSFLVSLKRPGGAAAKKKTPRGGVFFFAAAPRGRSLTHCGPGWCFPLAGVVFFFLLRPRPDGVVLFFLLWPRPDAHSLTVGWGDFGKVRVVFFFLLWPRPVFFG